MKASDLSSRPDFPRPGRAHPSDWVANPYSIALTSVVLFIIILGIATFIGFRQLETTKQNALTNDKTTANLLADLITEHNKATIGILQSYAHRPLFIAAVKKKDLAGVHRHLLDLKKNAEIDLTFVTDTGGVLWANFPVFSEAIGKDLSSRDWYKGISSNWKPYISNVFKLIVGDKPLAAAFCVPIVDERERPIGILATSQRLGFIDNIIERVPFSPFTTVNVIDRAGKILYSNKFPYRDQLTDYRFFPILEAALKGKKQQIEMKDQQKDQGKSSLTVVPVGDIGWTVIIERSMDDIYRSDLRRFIEIGAVSCLLFLLIIFFLGYMRKVSLFRKTEELLQTETKLRREEEKLRVLSSRQEAILAAVPEIIMEVDNNKIYTWANLAGTEFFGEDVIGKEAAFYFEGEQDTYDIVRPLFNGAADIIYLESWQRRKDGEKRLLAWWCRVLKDEDNSVKGVLSSARDITERKRMEKDLATSEARYRNLFDNAMEGIYQSTLEGTFSIVNPALAKMLGYENPADMITSVTDIARQFYANPEDRTRLLDAIKDIDYIENFEFLARRKDGGVIWILSNSRIIRNERGQIKSFEGIIQDISERKQAEEKIRQLNAELEQRVIDRTAELYATNKELEAFSYSVSHDLRAPLRSIDGFSQALLEEYQDKIDDTGKTYLNRVRKATQKMGFLIDDLLKLSRVTRSEFHYEAIDLSKIVREILQTTQENNPDRAVDIIIQEGIIVRGDPYLMQIALTNMMDNAWKFTGREAQPRIEFGATVKEGVKLYFLRDNGVGFDMAYVDKLFVAFQRLHTTEEFAGTGIGLATVRRIINRHGGHVLAEGEVGKGATLYFTLPS